MALAQQMPDVGKAMRTACLDAIKAAPREWRRNKLLALRVHPETCDAWIRNMNDRADVGGSCCGPPATRENFTPLGLPVQLDETMPLNECVVVLLEEQS